VKIRSCAKLSGGVAACLLLALFTGVTPSGSQTATTAPVAGGKMVVGIASNLLHADASDSNDRYILEATQYVYEGLFARDDGGKVIPGLAKSYTVSPNGLVYTFHLQPSVVFHDGTPFNAAAVKANLERKVAKKLALYWMLDAVKTIDVVDDLTVRLNLTRPNAALPTELALGTFVMVSPAAASNADPSYLKTHAVGTGPFTLQEFKSNEIARFRKNPRYWHKGLPYLDEVELRVIPDISARGLALQAGEVDLVVNLSTVDVARFRGNSSLGVTVLSKDSADQWYGAINTQKPPLDDARVRLAMNYALDKTAIVKAVYGDGATVAEGPILGPMVSGFLRTGPYPYDPARAATLLKEAGWELNDKTGVREREGKPLNVDVWSLKDAIQGDAQTAELIQAHLRKVGIGANFVVLDPGFWKAQVTVAPDKAKYDLLNLGWGTFTCDAEYTMNYMFRSDAMPPDRRNRMYYKSAAVDGFIDMGNKQPTLQLRNQYYGQAIKQIFQDAPILQLFQLKEEIAFRSTLHGAQIDACQLIHPAQFAWKSR
jgi:ABC-type transport system substrate-binding protein